ncbi:MAG: carboxypeptidase regulatory-like domain-containing protein [Smithella sp.]|jgi:hypothetical protein
MSIKKKFILILWGFLMMLLAIVGCDREGVSSRTYSISGSIFESNTNDDISGVTVELTGSATASTTTNSAGEFSFTGLENGTYTITPSLANYTFEPENAEIVINGEDVDDIDFAATYSESVGPYSISGVVTGYLSQGVTITLSGDADKTTTTNASGNYSFTGLADGNYAVTPSFTDSGFTPAILDVVVSGASETDKDFTATLIATSTYYQSDLTGKWKIQQLTADSSSQWMRAVVDVDASGVVTCETYEDSDGGTICSDPDDLTCLDLTWTIDEDGKITESGEHASTDMTMASNKNFIAGTGSLRIAQKIDSSTVFSSADLNDKSFVHHRLKTGAANEWGYGEGTVSSDGTMTITSETTPSGSVTPGVIGTLSVDSTGVISLSGVSTFKGFIADDKKTLVATETDDGDDVLWIIQITGKTYIAGSLSDSVANVHMLAGGTNPAPLSAYWTATTFGGTMVASNYWVSNSDLTAPVSSEPSINANGVITISGDTYHGQLSYDEKFIVGTKTLDDDSTPFGYALIVHTIK